MDSLKNFAASLVATAPSPATSGTSLVVTAGQGSYFPATPFDATIWPAGSQPSNTNAEIVRVTNVSTDTFTITRAQYGTTAQSITAGYQIAQTVDANLIGQLAPLSGATFTGAVTSPDFVASGLTGATGGYRWVGSKTTSGAPTSGTFAVGDMMWDITATLWICTIAGTPGTWNPVSSIDLTRRSATATAILGEVTIFTGSTASQTITLPANPVAGTSYAIVNNASVTVNILGGTNSLSIENVTYTATTPYTVPVGAGYGFVFDGTGIWYGTWTTDITNLVGTLAVTNGGTGTATAPAIGSIPVATSTSVYSPLAIGANNTVLTSNGTTASWATYAGSSSITTVGTVTSGTWSATTIATNKGGTGTTTNPAVGSIPVGSSTSAYTPLAISATSGAVLTSSGTTAQWTAPTGTGNVAYGTNPVITGAYETVSTSATALSGSTAAALAASTSSFYLYTANPTASFTVNLTNVPTTTGQAVTFAFGVVNGATAYLPLNITINGTQAGASSTALPLQGATNNSITSYYQGGTAWSAADVSTLDYYTITCICTGSSAWTMLLALTKF